MMVGRNEAKTAAAARAIMSATGHHAVHWEIADLARQDAVRELAARLLVRFPVIDLLINNAGALFLTREETPEGVERTIALNHLAYVTLTLALLPSLLAAAQPGVPARVVCVSSRAHQNARVRLDDLQMRHRYGGWRAYCNSKLFNIWFVRALARRVPVDRLQLFSMHPGVVRTRFALNNGGMGHLLRRLMDLFSVTPEQGADTILWLATAEEPLRHPGTYWTRRQRRGASRQALDERLAEQLWTETLRLTGFDAEQMIRAACGEARHA